MTNQHEYELKAWYETKETPNDHLSFNLIEKKSGIPVDSFDIYREGDRYLVRGYWKDYNAAKEWAEQVLT